MGLAPSGEPARSSCSAEGLPSPELDPRRLPAEWATIERRICAVRVDRAQQQFVGGAIKESRSNIHARFTCLNQSVHPSQRPRPTLPKPTDHIHCESTTKFLPHSSGISGQTVVVDRENGCFGCRWRREPRINRPAHGGGVHRQWQTVRWGDGERTNWPATWFSCGGHQPRRGLLARGLPRLAGRPSCWL